MNPMERADHAPEEFARYLAEQRAQMSARCVRPRTSEGKNGTS